MPKKKPTKESPKDTAMPTLVPRPDGRGALYAGGVPGNKGGGRPPSEIRTDLRSIIADNTNVLRQYIDGTVYVRLRQRCTECGAEPKADPETPEELLKLVPNHGDRLKAWDTAAKYSIGTLTAVDEDDVRGRIMQQIALIKSKPAWEAEELLKAMEPIWQ